MTNLQGDIIAIVNTSNVAVVEYVYDAWGNVLSIGGSMATTLGTLNPLTYRGYVYDQEYGLYYLQSRYYNPEIGRFLNADAFVSTGQGLLGNNMLVYCNNNPVNCTDPSGTITMVCYGNDVDMLSMPWKGVGAGGYRNTTQYCSTYDKNSELIMNQSDFEYSEMPVGLGTYKSSGCAVIGTYNVMQLLGKPQSLGSICDEYLHEHGSILYGGFGVGPWSFDNYFAKHGVSCTGYASFSCLNSNISEGDVVIFTIMNNSQNIFKGFHTMAAQYINGTYIVYNAYSDCYSGSPMSNLNNVSENSQWLYGYIVGG